MNTNKIVIQSLGLMLLASACSKKEAPGQQQETATTISRAVTSLGPIQSGGTYRIRALVSHPSGPGVEVAGMSTADGAGIQQWAWFPNDGQKWKITKIDATYYKITNVNSGKCLEVPGGATTPNLQLRQWTDNATGAQRWKIDYMNDYTYTLTNRASGIKIVVDPNDATNGRWIRQVTNVTGMADRFVLHNLNYQNPIISSGTADPYVVQKDGSYYFLCTKGNRITIRKTPFMSLLGAIPEITVWTPPAGTMYSANIWAPEMHFLDGKWYIYFAADNGNDDNHRMYVIENPNTDPTTGTWTFKGKITDASDQWAIDGTVWNTGGSKWFLWSGWENVATKFKQHIYIAKMASPWQITGPRVKISSPSNNWEKYEGSANGDFIGNTGVNEGPEILRQYSNGLVTLVFSASRFGSDNYCLGTLTLRGGGNPLVAADWINKKQVFVKSAANSVYGPGHNSFFTSSYIDGNGITKSENWIIYHARSTANTPNGTRTARMQRFIFNSDQTPNFGIPAKTGIDVPVPIGE